MTAGGSRLHAALSDQQALALIHEAQSAQNLLRDSVEAIRGLRHPLIHGDAVFTLGSIGVEKTLKLLLGCDDVERLGRWPSLAQLRAWGHDIENLDNRVRNVARDGLVRATASGYAVRLLERVEASTVLPLLFATLSRYGRSGRFHDLDVLATDQPGPFDPPRAHWSQLANHVVEQEPGFEMVPSEDAEAFEHYLGGVSRRIAQELNEWWFMLHRLAVQGCFGRLGKNVGFAIWDPARPIPPGIG